MLETINEVDISDCTDIESIIDRIYAEAASVPTVDGVPVVHAKWTGGKYYNGTYGYEKTCTNCKKEYVVVYGYLFCPYCGARMDG